MFLVKYTRILLAFTHTPIILNLSSWNTKRDIFKNVLVALSMQLYWIDVKAFKVQKGF